MKHTEEELRAILAKHLGEDIDEIGGGFDYGQFWNGPDEYPIEDVKKLAE